MGTEAGLVAIIKAYPIKAIVEMRRWAPVMGAADVAGSPRSVSLAAGGPGSVSPVLPVCPIDSTLSRDPDAAFVMSVEAEEGQQSRVPETPSLLSPRQPANTTGFFSVNLHSPSPSVSRGGELVLAERQGSSSVAAPAATANGVSWGRVALGVGGLVLLAAGVIAVLVVTKGAAIPFVAKAMPWLATEIVEPLVCLIGAGLCMRAWSKITGKAAETQCSSSSLSEAKQVSTAPMLMAAPAMGVPKVPATPAGRPQAGSFYQPVPSAALRLEDEKAQGCWSCFRFGKAS